MKARHSVLPRTMSFVFYEDQVLLMKAGATKEWTGIYNPLGGHIEKGEDVLESAIREIKEESGLAISDTKLRGIIHVTDFFGKNIIMFVTSSQSPTKKVNSNHEGKLEWVPIDKLDQHNIIADVKPILQQVLNLKPGQIFTGISHFDGQGELISLKFYPH